MSIASDSERLLCISDSAIHPIHLEQPDWFIDVDLNPDEVFKTRKKIFDIAASEKALVFAYHFPFPGLGYVIQKGNTG